MSYLEDFAKGFDLAKRGQTENLFHNKCGKKVVISSYLGYTCLGCSQVWSSKSMAGFDDDAMATRFHVRPPPDREEYTLVEVSDEKEHKCYWALVPSADASKYKPVKL